VADVTGKKRFDTAARVGVTAEEGVQTSTSPAAETPRRQDGQTSDGTGSPDVTKSAYTWRLTLDQLDEFDGLVLRLRRQVRPARLDKQDVLAALLALAVEDDTIRGRLVERLRRDVGKP
jgi:hypothetical protein